jgi:hypothetical protein
MENTPRVRDLFFLLSQNGTVGEKLILQAEDKYHAEWPGKILFHHIFRFFGPGQTAR